MKILFVVTIFAPAWGAGGGVRVSYELSKALVKKGHQVDVCTTDMLNPRERIQQNTITFEGVRACYFKNISNRLAHKQCALSFGLEKFLRDNIKNYDVVHIHEYRSFAAIIMHHYAMKHQIPYILQAHGSILPIFEKQGLKKFYDAAWGNQILRDASKLIAVSKVEKYQYLKIGIPENKIEIIPNGIDVSEYETLPERGKFRKKYGITSDEKVVLYLGRLHKRKGIDFLINGFSSLSKQHKNAKLIIVGPDNGFLDILIMQIKNLEIEDKVIFTGTLSENEKIEAFVDADVLIYPGILEIFGLVPFEAIMCGTPVIVADDCGCGEIIEEANCGYLVTYGDIEGLSTKISEVLTNSDDANAKVRCGQQYIKENLQYNMLIKKLFGLYDSCR